jgi:hypothetical protein
MISQSYNAIALATAGRAFLSSYTNTVETTGRHSTTWQAAPSSFIHRAYVPALHFYAI